MGNLTQEKVSSRVKEKVQEIFNNNIYYEYYNSLEKKEEVLIGFSVLLNIIVVGS